MWGEIQFCSWWSNQTWNNSNYLWCELQFSFHFFLTKDISWCLRPFLILNFLGEECITTDIGPVHWDRCLEISQKSRPLYHSSYCQVIKLLINVLNSIVDFFNITFNCTYNQGQEFCPFSPNCLFCQYSPSGLAPRWRLVDDERRLMMVMMILMVMMMPIKMVISENGVF